MLIVGMKPDTNNETVMVARDKQEVLWVKRKEETSAKHLANWLEAEAGEASVVFVDGGKEGGAIVDIARNLGVPVEEVTFCDKATYPYLNKRSELWGKARRKVCDLTLQIKDKVLSDDIARTAFCDNGKGLILEQRTQTKERVGRFPNSGDALALTFA